MKNLTIQLKTNLKYLIEIFPAFERFISLINDQISFQFYRKRLTKIKKRKP